MTASVASLIPQNFVAYGSTTPPSTASKVEPSSTCTPLWHLPAWCSASNRVTRSVPLKPLTSASVRATTSKLEAYLRMAYWSSPRFASPKVVKIFCNSISVAPAPATRRLSFVSALNTLIPSSMARSTSSRTFWVAPRMTMVESFESSLSWAKLMIFFPPTSVTSTESHAPRSSIDGTSRRARVRAPTAAHKRRISNLEETFTAMIPYRFRK
mmetsp:Transcript_59227/g.68558  ORF Transcript_59227/g.68558 Transcript_59227/m.68558 type:complete len:212 (-) Transcript_59227:963-1598(-)